MSNLKLDDLVAEATLNRTVLEKERIPICMNVLKEEIANEIRKQLKPLLPSPRIKVVLDTAAQLKRIAHYFPVQHEKAIPLLRVFVDNTLESMNIQSTNDLVVKVQWKKLPHGDHNEVYDVNGIEVTIEFKNPMF